MKKYENPMLQVVSIRKQDIIATSDQMGKNGNYGDGSGISLGAPGLRTVFDPDDTWANAGY